MIIEREFIIVKLSIIVNFESVPSISVQIKIFVDFLITFKFLLVKYDHRIIFI